MHKGTRQKSLWVSNFTLLKVVWVSNFAHLKVVFKWYHGSEGVKYVYTAVKGLYIYAKPVPSQTNTLNLTNTKHEKIPQRTERTFIRSSPTWRASLWFGNRRMIQSHASTPSWWQTKDRAFHSFHCFLVKELPVRLLLVKGESRRNDNFVSNVSTLKKRQTFLCVPAKYRFICEPYLYYSAVRWQVHYWPVHETTTSKWLYSRVRVYVCVRARMCACINECECV